MKMLTKKWLELTTLAIAIVALFLSWQANTIGRSQITPQIVLIDTKPIEQWSNQNSRARNSNGHLCFLNDVEPTIDGEPIDGEPRARMICGSVGLYCAHQFRIANLGGASTSIVNFEATIFYLDQKVFLAGEGDAVAQVDRQGSNFDWTKISLTPSISSVTIDNLEFGFLSVNLLQLPFKIEEFSTVDVFALSEIVNAETLDTPLETPFSAEEPYAYNVLDITYLFEFSSGEKLVTPPIPCLYVTQQ
jgi:hypothetical protein